MADMLSILQAAVQMGASDVHLIVGKPPMMRLHGEMHPMPGLAPLSPEETKRLAYSVLLENQRARFEEAYELDCSFAVPNLSRFRLNCYVHQNGLAAVMRVIPSKIPSPQELGLAPSVVQLIDNPRGLVLVTGPTGCGKSTTLACMIEAINARYRRNIITIEDPVEFTYQNKLSVIQQRELLQQTKSFQEALRHSLRQDPDVILIGEMRDLETISLALTAAETGHLVFATIHTQDAPTSVDRIVDVFPPHQQQQIRIQLATSLRGVVSQILLPRADGKGRVAAREVMVMTSAIGSLIREGKTHLLYSAIETGRKFGMISMDQHLAELVLQRLIHLNEALAKAHDADSLRTHIRSAAASPAGQP
ncbi:MAG: type IV pilus twitching motility protein PilT [Elusimicrobia bacterium]|nr:type IV pilus twitching motility protein PilT [Elusimicrobiota bacterium]